MNLVTLITELKQQIVDLRTEVTNLSIIVQSVIIKDGKATKTKRKVKKPWGDAIKSSMNNYLLFVTHKRKDVKQEMIDMYTKYRPQSVKNTEKGVVLTDLIELDRITHQPVLLKEDITDAKTGKIKYAKGTPAPWNMQKELSWRWNNLSEKDKEYYTLEAEKDKERFYREVKEWGTNHYDEFVQEFKMTPEEYYNMQINKKGKKSGTTSRQTVVTGGSGIDHINKMISNV